MDCPICNYPILADSSTCRRCGAPLHVPIVEAKVPGRTALLGKRASGAGGGVQTPVAPAARTTPDPQTSPAARAAAYLKHASNGELLPGAFSRPDNLLPRATRATVAPKERVAPERPVTPATVRVGAYTVPIVGARAARDRSPRRQWRRGVATGAAAIAVTMGAIAVWPIAFGGRTSPPAAAAATALNESRTRDLLRTVVTAARGAYTAQHSYTGLSSESLGARAHDVPVVRAFAAASEGTVSLRVNTAGVLTLASPAGSQRCVFARDDAARDTTMFVAVTTSDCRASAAPATGWSAR
jgi:hypothetical protein